MNTTQQTVVIEGDNHMRTNRQAATFVGVCFIIATLLSCLSQP